MAARDLKEAIADVQSRMRTLTDAGRTVGDPTADELRWVVQSLANIVEGMINDDDVPWSRGQAIR